MYHITPNLATTEAPFFLVHGRDPNLPFHQLLEPIQQFLSDPNSGCLDLRSHQPVLAIAKKTLEENCFKHVQKMMHHTQPNFKVGNRVFFKNRQPCEWDLRWKAGYRILHIEQNGYYLHLENQATGKTRPCNVKDVVQ